MKRILLLLLLTILIGLAAIATFKWDKIELSIKGFLVERIKKESDFDVEIENFTFSLPLTIHSTKISVKERGEVLFVIDGLNMKLSIIDFIHQHIAFHELHIKKLSLFSSEEHMKTNIERLSWDDISHPLLIDDLQIAQIIVDKSYFKNSPLESLAQLTPGINGKIAIKPNEKTAHIDLTMSGSNVNEQIQLVMAITHPNHNFEMQSHLRIAEKSWLAQKLLLPAGYNYQAFLHIIGSNKAWEKLIYRETTGAEEILRGDLQLSYTGQPTQDITSHQLLGKYGSVKAPFSLSSQMYLSVPRLEGLLGNILFDGAFSLNPELIINGSTLHVYSPPHPLFEEWVISDLNMNFKIDGTLISPEVWVRLDSTKLRLPNSEIFEDVEIGIETSLNFIDPITNFSGAMDIQGKWQQQDVALSTHFNWDIQQEVHLSDISMAIGTQTASGKLSLSLPDFQIAGELEGQIDLHPLSGWLNTESKGTVLFNTQFAPDSEGHSGMITFNTAQLSITEVAMGKTEGKATIKDLFGKPEVFLELNCESGNWQQWDLNKITLQGDCKTKQNLWPFSLSFTTGKGAPIRIDTSGSWDSEKQELALVVQKIDGMIGNSALQLENPISVKLNQQGVDLAPFFCKVGSGSIEGSLNLNSNDIALNFEAKAFSLDLLNHLGITMPIKGVANTLLQIDSPLESLCGNIKLDINNIEFVEELLTKAIPIHLTFNALLQDQFIDGSGKIQGLSPEPISLEAKLPVTIALSPLQLALDNARPLWGKLALQGRIESILEHLIPISAVSITGDVDVAVEVGGTLSEPQVTGYALVNDGSVESFDLGTIYKGIKAKIDLKGHDIELAELSAHPSAGGFISATGQAKIDLANHFPYDLHLQLDHVDVFNQDFAKATASGDLNLKGNVLSAVLKGKISTDKVYITLPEQLPDIPDELDITFINSPEGIAAPARHMKTPSPLPTTLDVELVLQDKIYIKDNDFTSEWKGRIHATGTADTPLLNGNIKLINGEFQFQGKKFQLSEGLVTFAGDPEKKTTLYVIASKEIEALKVDIILKGWIKRPAVSFRSNPPLPQREILSWILFNQGTSDITPFQGTQLNESITKLKSGKSGPDMLTKIRNSIGIDRIDISRGGASSEAVSLQVGKYLSNGIFVSVNKGITADTNKMGIEAPVMRNVKVKAEVGDDASGQLFLRWKKDY